MKRSLKTLYIIHVFECYISRKLDTFFYYVFMVLSSNFYIISVQKRHVKSVIIGFVSSYTYKFTFSIQQIHIQFMFYMTHIYHKCKFWYFLLLNIKISKTIWTRLIKLYSDTGSHIHKII